MIMRRILMRNNTTLHCIDIGLRGRTSSQAWGFVIQNLNFMRTKRLPVHKP